MSKTSQRKQSKNQKPTPQSNPTVANPAPNNQAQLPPKVTAQRPVNHRPMLPQRAARKR
jgi:hypothetical protein